jgi:hypothetical protein
MNKKTRQFNTEYRKKLLSKFENIKDKSMLIDIYNIIIGDIGNNFSSNINGIFIDINIVSDTCIENINNYFNQISTIISSNIYNTSTSDHIYKLDDIEILSEIGHKLSSQEKCIIKRMRNES